MNAVFNTSYGKVGLSTAPMTESEISEFSSGKLDLSKSGLTGDFKGTWGLASKAYVGAALQNHGSSNESHIDIRSKLEEQSVKIARLETKLEKLATLLVEHGISIENQIQH